MTDQEGSHVDKDPWKQSAESLLKITEVKFEEENSAVINLADRFTSHFI